MGAGNRIGGRLETFPVCCFDQGPQGEEGNLGVEKLLAPLAAGELRNQEMYVKAKQIMMTLHQRNEKKDDKKINLIDQY